jgi:phenylacetate-coenzyme A ligase PaaK-like adenylate-forming protein
VKPASTCSVPHRSGLPPSRDVSERDLRRRAYGWLLRNLILPLGDGVFRQGMTKHLKLLEQAQWWEPDRVSAERNGSLRALVETAYRQVPLYRDLMDGARVRPGEIRTIEDLPRLPVTTKRMLRAGYPGAVIRRTGHRTYEARSSGSTGTNMVVLEDAETAGRHRACLMLALEWSGWRLGDRHVQTGMTLHRSLDRRLKDLFLRCHYVSAFDLSDRSLDATLEILASERIEHLWGYPGSLFVLACRAGVLGWNGAVRSVVTWGDTLYARYRRTIEAAFGARVFDTYGCGEGIQVAAQCGVSGAYHLHALDTVVECLRDDGLPARPGERGHLILTRLHPGPMPLIRYRVGDLGVLGPAQRCACGRGFDRLESIEGRDTDVIVTPGGNRLIVHFFTGIFEHFPEIESFQVLQNDPHSMVVRLVGGAGFDASTPARVVASLREKGATDIEISVERVDAIPASPSGKRRFVISTVDLSTLDRTR